MYLVKRGKFYHIFYHDSEGILKSKSTKCTKKGKANQAAMEYLSSLEQKAISIHTIDYKSFCDFYKEYASSRFSASYREFVKYALQQFGRVIPDNKLLTEISVRDVQGFIGLKLTEAGERLVNGYLRTLQAAFERAVEMEYLEKNIFRVVKKLKPKDNPPLFLTSEEFQQILEEEKDNQLKFIYRVAVYTGMRMGELRHLKYSDIDFVKENITVRNHEGFTTKSKKSRMIPIHNSLKEDFTALVKAYDDKGYIFLYKGEIYRKDYLSERFKRVIRDCGLNDDYHFHTLRHTFASWLVQKGVSLYVVSKLLGHADIKTTQIYSHLTRNDLSDKVNLL